MDTPDKDRKFPWILAGHDNDEFIEKYNKLTHKLATLEKEYQENDPGFDMSPMWTCYCAYGHVEFNITEQCCEPGLKSRMLAIFKEVLG